MLSLLHERDRLLITRTLLLVLTGSLLSMSCGAASSKVELSLLHAWTGFREPLVNEMLDEFHREYPDITVEPRVVSNGVLHEQFTVAYAGGVAPDIVMTSTANLVSLAEQGAFLALNGLMERDGISQDIWYPSELAMGQLGHTVYGLPIRTGGEAGNVLYYNRQRFEEAGLYSDKAPATWSELVAYSKKLIRYDGDQIVMNPINDLTQGGSNQSSINWLYSGGGQFLNAEMRSVQFASQAATEMAEWVYGFRSQVYRKIGDDLMKNEDFYNGRSAMFFWGSEGFSFVWDQNPDFPLGVGPRPRREGSPYIGANTGTWNYAIPDSVKNQDAAWELLKWLTIRKESAGWFIRMQGRPSPIRKYNQHPEYRSLNPLFPVLGDILENVAKVPILPIHTDLAVPYRDAFRQIVKGQASARAVLDDAAARAQGVLDQYWRARAVPK